MVMPFWDDNDCQWLQGRLRLKCDGTRAETRFRLSAKRTSLFKSAGALVQSTTGSRGVRITGSNAGYTMFRGSVKSTGYPLHSPVSPSLPLPYVTVCDHVSAGFYHQRLSHNPWTAILTAIWPLPISYIKWIFTPVPAYCTVRFRLQSLLGLRNVMSAICIVINVYCSLCAINHKNTKAYGGVEV